MRSFRPRGPALRLPGLAVIVGALLLGACRRSPDVRAEQGVASVTTVDNESIVVLDSALLRTGPAISGTLKAEREARIRAEIAGTVLETYVEQGQRVSKGTLLARLDDRSVQDAYLSAKAQRRSAETNLGDARRNAERAETLAAAGAVAERDLETARSAAANAEAAAADAQARLAAAQKQLQYTQVRAPISGVVSERAVNAGDVLQVGGALYTVIDPASLRLEGTVPAEQLGQLRVGIPVQFTVSGYGARTFTGTIDRINPTADPATRQVRVYVSIPNTEQRLVAGLYAEGQVGTQLRRTVLAPASAVDQRGVQPTVLRVRQGKVEQVTVQLGVRDNATDRVELKSGVAPGDTLLIGAATAIPPGTPVRVKGEG